MKGKRSYLILLAAMLLFVTGCSAKQDNEPITDVTDLEGRRVGVNMAWTADYMLADRDDMTLDGLPEL